MIFKKGYRAGYFAFSLCSILIILSVVLSSCGTCDVELDTAIENIATYEFGDSRESLTIVADLVSSSNGFPSIRSNLEKQLASVLESDDATLGCKDFICRQLAVMGTDESIPQLEKMLSDAATTDMARYALETNTSPRACEALRNALGSAEGKALIGIINTLGNRKNSGNADALRGLADSSDEDVSSAVAAALEKIE
jgi:hypothetical protein